MKSWWGALPSILATVMMAQSPVAHAAPELIKPDESLEFAGGNGEPLPAEVWWASFDDPALNRVIRAALDENGDVQSAVQRAEQAHAFALQARSRLIPTISASAGGTASPGEAVAVQFGMDELPPGAPPVSYTINASIAANYTLDLFGRNILAARSAARSALAGESDAARFRLVMAGQIAGTYYDVIAAKERLAAVQTQVENGRSLLALMELRYEAGQVSGVDLLQQRQQVAATESQLPGTALQVELTESLLNILIGGPIERFAVEKHVLPELPPAPGTGTPQDLVENRSDLMASYYRVLSAQDTKRSAWTNYAPTVTLGASYGVRQQTNVQAYLGGGLGGAPRLAEEEATITDGLSDMSNITQWNLSANASVPIFTGGANWGSVKAAKADESANAHSYNQAIRLAIYEVESALAQEKAIAEQLAMVRAQVEAAELAFTQSQERYVTGLDTYLSVLTSLNSLQQSQLSAVQAHRALLGARIQLHTALGGPWSQVLEAQFGEQQ